MNLTVRVDVDPPPETVFAAAPDWERQGEWILGTTGWGRQLSLHRLVGFCRDYPR